MITPFGAALLAVGSVIVLIAVRAFFTLQRFLKVAARADATVIRIEQEWNWRMPPTRHKERRWIYYPVFTFTDQSGRQHTVRSFFGQTPPAYAVGDTVLVLYPPEAPDQAKLATTLAIWGFPVCAGVFGAILLAVGLMLLFRSDLRGLFDL